MNSFDRATQAQRHLMLRLLKRAEFDERTCTLAHKKLAADACVHPPAPGDPVDDWLGGMTKNAATRIITRLKADLGEQH